MSIFSHFYLQDNFLTESFCDCFGGGGGDDGASARAEAAQKAREKRIKGNISLIDLLFKNDPESLPGEKARVEAELAGSPPGLDIQGGSGGGAAADFARKLAAQVPTPKLDKINALKSELAAINDASDLLTGPTKVQREARTIKDVEDFFFEDLNEQKIDAERISRFELSRRGGFGGSQQLDAQNRFQRKEDDARLKIGGVALDARNNLRVQDEELRSALIGQANSGLDRDVLTSDFVGRLDSGLSRARDTAKLTRFDPFFETAGNLFTDVELIRGNELGRERANRLQSFFSADPDRNFGTVRR